MKKSIYTGIALAIILAAGTQAFAQSVPTPATLSGASLSTVISKGDAAIAKRIASLTSYNTRVSDLKHLSPSEVSTIQAIIQTGITDMNNAKAKLDADTDVTTAQADYKAIFDDNRIYAVVMPEVRTMAVTDNYLGDVATLQSRISTLQTSVTAAASAGKDTTQAQAWLTDATAKISDAQSQASAATTAVASLQVDDGNATIIASNKATDTTVRADITNLHTDEKAISSDLKQVREWLKGNK